MPVKRSVVLFAALTLAAAPLHAQAPVSRVAPREMEQFRFFIGEWTFTAESRMPGLASYAGDWSAKATSRVGPMDPSDKNTASTTTRGSSVIAGRRAWIRTSESSSMGVRRKRHKCCAVGASVNGCSNCASREGFPYP